MATRGRKSLASQVTAIPTGVNRRLPPPAELTQAERSVWRDIVESMPGDFFHKEHESVLIQLCRHRVQATIIAQQINNMKPEWLTDEDGLKRYDKLHMMMERNSKAITALMRSMRLTKASQQRQEIKVDRHGARAPWDYDDPITQFLTDENHDKPTA